MEESPVPTEYDAEWVPEPIWTLWSRELIGYRFIILEVNFELKQAKEPNP
jgi:hypothetical protein